MRGTWLERLRGRFKSTWDVLTGRAYAAYELPDHMGEVRLRIALQHIENHELRDHEDYDAIKEIASSALSAGSEHR